ncbi:MAG TPA: hypothetical protein VFP54_00890 [Acidimicrobiales bacterium]|nr:hypothetical protein [Acidimicrobiales bacterium]
MRYPTPAAGTPETVYIASTSARTPVSLTVYYKTSPSSGTPYPAPGSPGVTTNSTGQAQFTFVVSANSANYPVIVEVNVGHVADECETHFTPST